MSKPENTFIQSIHRHLPLGRKDPYWMKNNNLYTSGIWDVWYSGVGADLWVEYKFVVLPKRDDTVIDLGLSELQLQWGRDRDAEGRNLAVIVGCKEGGAIFTGGGWEETWTRKQFATLLMSRKDTARWLLDRTMTGTV